MRRHKNSFLLPVAMTLVFFNAHLDMHAQSWLDKAKHALKDVTGGKTIPLTEADAAQAIREALSQGVGTGTDLVSKLDGYFGNPEIKIPFPKDAEKVEKTMRQIELGDKVDQAVLSINRAAELAAIEAKPIFLSAIKNITIKDAIGIVKGKEHSATDYLQTATTDELVKKFAPIIKSALDKVEATKYWTDVIKTYNKLPLVHQVNPDLTDYTTRKAIEGLFTMIAKEESNIRQNPSARTTDLLKKVFGK